MSPRTSAASEPSAPPLSEVASDWEARARRCQADPSGVLLKSLPPILNAYLHDWHVAEVLEAAAAVAGDLPLRGLDVGCGYGRLSQALRRAYPKAKLVGIDISDTFSRLYIQQSGGPAIRASAAAVPIREAVMDLVVVVTTLMYLSPAERQRAVRDLIGILRPGGRAVIIEGGLSGERIYTGFGLFTALARLLGQVDRGRGTGGLLFGDDEIDGLVARAGGSVVRRSGVPRFTYLLPFLVVAERAGARDLVRALLRRCRPRQGVSRHSLHLCYHVQRAV